MSRMIPTKGPRLGTPDPPLSRPDPQLSRPDPPLSRPDPPLETPEPHDEWKNYRIGFHTEIPGPVPAEIPCMIDTIKEEEEEEICPICMITINTEKEPYVTACNHTFCQDCIQKYHAFCANQPIHCPICRANIQYVPPKRAIHVRPRPPFTEDLCPPNETFDFIEDEFNRRMIQSAYNTITRLNQWKIVHDYVVDEQLGFMHSRSDPEIVALMTRIDDDYRGHSGFSLAFTMRKIHFIAIYGLAEFKRLTCDQNT